jgi:hypothetical protein
VWDWFKIMLIAVTLLVGATLGYGLLRLGSEQERANCLAEASLRFPAEDIDANDGKSEYVSNTEARNEAIDEC